jgi:PAS domain S-box-containing protein
MEDTPRILIVDDDENTCRSLTLIFGKKGHETETAGTGREAIEKARVGFFNLALVDIRLPDMEGVELIAPLQELHPDMAVIMITGYASLETAVRALNEGASAYITKPLNMDEVLAVVREALEKQRLVIEKRRAEEALRESKELFEKTFSSQPDALFILNAEIPPTILDCNPAATEVFGYTRQEMLGRTTAFLHIDEAALRKFQEHLYPAIEERGFLHLPEFRMKRKDGTVFPTEHSVMPLEDEQGKHLGWVSVVRDITERKRAEEELRDSEERFRDLYENAPNAYFSVGVDGRIRRCNRRAGELLEYAVEELVGRPVLDLYADTPHGKEKAAKVLQRFRAGETLRDEELQMQKADGTPVWISLTVNAVRDAQGRVVESRSMVVDITERKRAEEQIQRQLQRLSALHNIEMAITASLDLRITLGLLLNGVITQLSVDAADVLLLNRPIHTLEYIAGRGFRTAALRHTYLRLGQSHAGRAALERCIVNVPNLPEDVGGLAQAPLLAGENFVAYYAAPLIAKGEVKGVLEIFHRAPLDPDLEWLRFLETLATQAAIAIDNTELFEGLQRSNAELTLAYNTTLEGWAHALELRDHETEGHTRRVTDVTIRLAQAMGMSDEELVHVRRGVLLHDIGKMGIPDSILLKPASLTEEEWEIMRRHPVHAHEMLSPIAYLRPALDIPYCHHEKWDGTGYPRGLKGEQIPLAARIFAVVDVWDALNSDRPYRDAWPEEKALDYIREQAGEHFDPRVVEVFMRMKEVNWALHKSLDLE